MLSFIIKIMLCVLKVKDNDIDDKKTKDERESDAEEIY